MNSAKAKIQIRARRQKRVRAKISGTAARPRLSVFRSLKHTYAQLIDDENQRTLLAVKEKKEKVDPAIASGAVVSGKVAAAAALGRVLAEKALAQGIKQAVFDKGSAKYHGRVKAVAEGARAGGLKI